MLLEVQLCKNQRPSTNCPSIARQNAWFPRKKVLGACRYVERPRVQSAASGLEMLLTELRSPPHVALLHLRYVEERETRAARISRRGRGNSAITRGFEDRGMEVD
jgi:hypothetical protein